MRSGWQAIIDTPQGPDFREFVLIYHEVGDEAFRPVNKKGDFLPQRDPLTDTYRPGGRALNYRSEPFGLNNMHVQHEYFGFEDESMGYSSYTFGDAPTTIPRSYLGDPAKFRLVHGGSEVFHSHHPHGGTIRWLRSPRSSDEMQFWFAAKNGPVTYPVIRTKSDRVDVQVIGPSEVFDLDTGCGSGLCQQLAGDFLFHCHVARHYVAGMWGYWRVYNTMQQGDMHTDVMPDLRELPDRKGRIKFGVTSDKLVGKTLDWFGKTFQIVEKGKTNWKGNPAVVTIKDWVEMQLPTQGKPGHKDDEKGQIQSYDATVLDWGWKGTTALTEKESTIVDPNGLIFALHEEEEAVRKNNDLKYPLVFRANVYDCVDYTLTSEWVDDDFTNFQSSKINIHPHFLQFDNQATDGVITGMSYEQSVRPFTMLEKKDHKGLPAPMNTVFTAPAKAGSKSFTVKNAAQYHVGTELLIGADNVKGNEIQRIASISGTTITLQRPLKNDHPKGDIVTVEFTRSRLWVDADVGTVFWHDHAFGATTWPHGGFGTLIVEPVGSTYHDPKTGKPIRSGPVADIHTVEPVGYGVNGSFRELTVQVHDTVPHTVNVVTEGNPPGQPIEVALEGGKTVSFMMPERIAMTPMTFLHGGA